MRSIKEVEADLDSIGKVMLSLEKEKREIQEANYKPTLEEAVSWFRYRTIGSEKGNIRVETPEGVYTVEKSFYAGQNTVVTCPHSIVDGVTSNDFGCPIDGIRKIGERVHIYFKSPPGMQ